MTTNAKDDGIVVRGNTVTPAAPEHGICVASVEQACRTIRRSKYRLSIPRPDRTNWRIWFRNNRRALVISLIGFVLFLLTTQWLAYAMSHSDAADYRLRLSSLQHEMAYIGTFGAWTPTDIRKGTTVIDLRRVR